MQSKHMCDGANWFPKLDAADPVRGAEAQTTPAFRTTGNKCLTTKQAATTLTYAAEGFSGRSKAETSASWTN